VSTKKQRREGRDRVPVLKREEEEVGRQRTMQYCQ
jgi:hypothetical protein